MGIQSLSKSIAVGSIVRETVTTVSITVNVIHSEGAVFYDVSPAMMFDFEVFQSEVLPSYNDTVTKYSSVVISQALPAASMVQGTSVSLSLSFDAEFLVSACPCLSGSCPAPSMLCVKLTASSTASYLDPNSANNIACLNLTNNIICKPCMELHQMPYRDL